MFATQTVDSVNQQARKFVFSIKPAVAPLSVCLVLVPLMTALLIALGGLGEVLVHVPQPVLKGHELESECLLPLPWEELLVLPLMLLILKPVTMVLALSTVPGIHGPSTLPVLSLVVLVLLLPLDLLQFKPNTMEPNVLISPTRPMSSAVILVSVQSTVCGLLGVLSALATFHVLAVGSSQSDQDFIGTTDLLLFPNKD